MNPHSWIYVDVLDSDGQARAWAIEGASVTQLRREAGTRQVEGATVGFTCNFGGFGNNVVCLTFVREN